MDNVTIYVGLDYHQNSIQVCVMDQSGKILTNQKCGNEWTEVHKIVSHFGPLAQVAIESCCGAADLAEELIRECGWSVSLAHPGYVARMKQGPDKTDWGDARLLADLVRVGYLPKVWLAPENIRELRRLVRYRQQLADERRNAKLRIRALLRDQRASCESNAWTKAWFAELEQLELPSQSRWILQQHLAKLGQLKEQLAAVEKRLIETTAEDAIVAKLQTYKGVGLITAVTLRAEIGRFDRFRSGKQLARFCGFSPRNASSGERVADAGLVKAINPQLRATLLQSVHCLSRYDERWSALRNRLLLAGKPRNVATAAVGNRWLRWLYHEMQTLSVAA
jgi:transposase